MKSPKLTKHQQFILDAIAASEVRQTEDLKQFVLATVSQSETRTNEWLETIQVALQAQQTETAAIHTDMDAGFAGVSEIVSFLNDELADFDRRITKFEQRSA